MTNHLKPDDSKTDWTLVGSELASHLSKELEIDISIVVTDEIIDPILLSAGEQNTLASISSPKSRESYLRGRAALKPGLRQLNIDDDTSKLNLPHQQISLTHSGSYAIAAIASEPQLLGIGIDFETDRLVKKAMSKFFMTQDEMSWLQELAEDEQKKEILRLWTVKEALFKSDPDNRDHVLRHYTVITPGNWTGLARIVDNQHSQFSYSTLNFKDGFLSLALRKT